MNLNQLEANNSNKKSGNSYLQGKNLSETFLHTFGFFGDPGFLQKSNLFSFFLKTFKDKSVQSLLMNYKIMPLIACLKTFCQLQKGFCLCVYFHIIVIRIINAIIIIRSSTISVLQKEVCLKNLQNSQENTCARVSILLKKKLRHRCFPVNFAKFLKTPFLKNTSGQLLLNHQSIHRRLNLFFVKGACLNVGPYFITVFNSICREP